jgi:hypothetical protein
MKIRRLLPVLLAPALLGAAVPAAAHADAATPAPAAAAASWLASSLSSAGTVVGSYDDGKGNIVSYTDWGRTLDAAIGLLAAGGQDATLGRALTSAEAPDAVAAYTQGAPGDEAGAAYVGATAKLAFVVAATGGDPAKAGGVDLLSQLLSLQTADGRFADRSSYGDYANVFGHAFALLALTQSGRTPPTAVVNGLESAACPDGSFPETYPTAGAACTGSVDATGLVLQALAAVGRGSAPAAQAAGRWLTGQQKSDGSFPGQAPVNSTGYAAAGLAAVGAATGAATDYLVGQQDADGGLRTGAAGATGGDVFATAQALPALAGKTFSSAARTVARQAVLSLATHLVGATHSAAVTVLAPVGSTVELSAYSRPSTTFHVVRTATVGSTGAVTWQVGPLTNTRLYAQVSGAAPTPQEVLGVATALSMSVSRTATRTYRFTGHSAPARSGGLIVSLYRLTADGHAVLTAQTRASATSGDWALTRVFTGTGTFGFVVRTGADMSNAPGSSAVRRLTIS